MKRQKNDDTQCWWANINYTKTSSINFEVSDDIRQLPFFAIDGFGGGQICAMSFETNDKGMSRVNFRE